MENICDSLEEYPLPYLRKFSFEEPRETRFTEHLSGDEFIFDDMNNTYPYSGNIPVILSSSLLPCVNATPPLPPLGATSSTPRSSMSSATSEASSKKSTFRRRWFGSKKLGSLTSLSTFSFSSAEPPCAIYDADDFFLPEKPTAWESFQSSVKKAGTSLKGKSRKLMRRVSFTN